MSVEMSNIAIQGRSDRRAEVLFEVAEDALLVANDGLPFTHKGVISICASHLSDKHFDPNDNFEADDEYLVTAIGHREIATYRNDHNRITSDCSAEDETVHDYSGRFVWELLQNADDAMGTRGGAVVTLLVRKDWDLRLFSKSRMSQRSIPAGFIFDSRQRELRSCCGAKGCIPRHRV